MNASEYKRIRTDPEDYFQSSLNKVMFFSREAAKEIFIKAAQRRVEIIGYEGGILNSGKFEARLDAIWDRARIHEGLDHLEVGNLRAASAIEEEPDHYNAFVISGRLVRGHDQN